MDNEDIENLSFKKQIYSYPHSIIFYAKDFDLPEQYQIDTDGVNYLKIFDICSGDVIPNIKFYLLDYFGNHYVPEGSVEETLQLQKIINPILNVRSDVLQWKVSYDKRGLFEIQGT